MPPVKLLYVCNFDNIHARSLVAHFAARPESWSVTVLSTDPAAPMANVRLLELDPGRGLRRTVTRGRFGRFAYRMLQHAPGVLVWLRSLEFLIQVRRNRKRVNALVAGESFDILHALRMQPEAIIASELKRGRPDLPFFVTTWGQDLVLFSFRSRILARMTRAVFKLVDVLLPDNERDSRLAREYFALRGEARVHVIPATGGIRPDEMPDEFPALDIPGFPRLLSMRGYENSYIRLRVIIQAFARLLESHPDARLYIDVNVARRNPQRDELVWSWIRDAGVDAHVRLLHLNRNEVLGYMSKCEIYTSATVSDGLPMSLVEALWYGQLAVVHRLESLDNIARVTKGVRFYETIDADRITQAWGEAIQELPGRAERRSGNRAAINSEYNRSINLEKLGRLYREHTYHMKQ